MFKVFLISIFVSFNSFACDFYLERAEVAENQFFDLNILDSYDLGKSKEISNEKLKTKLIKIIPKQELKKEEIQNIQKNIAENKNFIYPINGLTGSLKSFLIKGAYSQTEYFSFIIHTSCQID